LVSTSCLFARHGVIIVDVITPTSMASAIVHMNDLYVPDARVVLESKKDAKFIVDGCRFSGAHSHMTSV